MITAYLRERFRVSFFGPLAMVLAIAALGWPIDGVHLLIASFGGLFLLAQFRIWDDIADRQEDATTHPHRVIVRAPSAAPLIGLGMGLLALNVGIATQRGATFVSLLLLMAIHAALGCYYLLRRQRTILGDQLLLAKYPAFVCVLAGERLLYSPIPVLLAAATVYAAASFYEAWHDPVSPLAQFLGDRS